MGIWGTLGKLGTGLGSMIPGVGPIISTLGPALSGRGGAPKPGFALDNTTQAGTAADRGRVTAAGDRMTGLSEFGRDQATGLMSDGRAGLAGASKYYSGLASGDPSKVMSTMAPAMNQSRSNQAQALDQIQRFGGRGGGASLAGRNARIQGASDRTRLYNTGIQEGVKGMASIGEAQTRMGLGAADMAARTGGEAGRLSLAQMGQDFNTQNMNNRVRAQQAGMGQVEQARNQQNAQAGAKAIAEQGGLGSTLKNIPGLFRKDGSSRIPGLGKLANLFGGNEQAVMPAGTMPKTAGAAPTSGTTFNQINNSLNGFARTFGGGSSTNAFAGQASKYPVSNQFRNNYRTAAGAGG